MTDQDPNEQTIGVEMGFRHDPKTDKWHRVHTPGSPIVLGLGDIGFSLGRYKLIKTDELLAISVKLHHITDQPDTKAGDLIPDDVNPTDYPVLQELRFGNIESATVVRNLMDAVIKKFELENAKQKDNSNG